VAKKITIRDVAEHAGTSYQTVSRVINNKGEVAPATRARVLQAIEALNYRPSMAARTLAQEQPRTAIIAVAIPFESDFLFGNAHLLQMLHGIDRAATRHDYSILLSTLRSASDPLPAYRRLLKRQMADGVIFESGMGDEGAKLLVEKGYPVVVSGYTQHDIPCVHADDENGAYVLTQHLLALGHRTIGIITGPADTMSVQARWRGYENAMRDAALDPELTPYVEGDFMTDSGYTGAARLWEMCPDITAIFAFNDLMALGAIRWLNERGCRVPGDVSVVGFDDIPTAELQCPPLTTVRLPSMENGQRVAQLLFEMLDEHPVYEKEIILPIQLQVRASTAVPPSRRG
jgi:LacI family transcriptional regulator, repressor for deo operon, udp, cdd, tsx, nupC, and nupG